MSRRNHCFNWDMRLYGTAEGWWDPSDNDTVTIATGVSQLDDKSGNARDMTQATGANQPTVASAAQNGLDALEFAAGQVQHLTVPSSTGTFKFVHDGSDAWIFQVQRNGADGATNPDTVFLCLGTAVTSTTFVGFDLILDDRSSVPRNDASYAQVSRGITPLAASVSSNNEYTSGSFFLRSVRVDANGSVANRILDYTNDSQVSAINSSNGTPSSSNSTFNLRLGSYYSFEGNGALGETIIYSALNLNYSISFINTLINHKWSVY